MQATIANVGRCLLALYFLLPGISKFIGWDSHVALMTEHGMVYVPFFLATAAIVQIACSLGILFKWQTQWLALVLAGLTLLINVQMHDFWNYEGLVAAHETQNFVKNLGLFAGLLMLSAFSWKTPRND